MRLVIGLVLVAGVSIAGVQQPLPAPSTCDDKSADEYEFKWPIQRVAIIGAGPSGVVAYRELTEAGLAVRIFERDSVPGGNWHYTEEVPFDAPVPNLPCVVADFVPSLPPANAELPYSEVFEDDGRVWRDHRGPKPVWASLTSDAPSPGQQFPRWPWPAGTPWEISHYQIRNYVRSYSSYLNINSNDGNPATAYRTRVERVEKRVNEAGQEHGWRLWLKSLEPAGRHTYNATWWTEDFDAVVVAMGKYGAPSMPSIPGLDDWVQRFPDLVRHSRQYRRPKAYANQTVLIIGASNSGSGISRDLNPHVRQIYQSIRPDTNPRTHQRTGESVPPLPKNTTVIGEVNRFLPIREGAPIQSGLVELRNGTVLSGVDSVILATGFQYSFPFLPQYYDGATYEPHEGSAKTVLPFLPLDGAHIRDLYLDLFYLRDPTLAFLGMTPGVQSFVFSQYLTLALAKVWTNTAKLPSSEAMRASHAKTIEERGGYGKHVLFLGAGRYQATIRYMIGWLNEAAVKYGGKQIGGLPEYFEEIYHYWRIARFGDEHKGTFDRDGTVLQSLGIVPVSGANEESEYDPIFDNEW